MDVFPQHEDLMLKCTVWMYSIRWAIYFGCHDWSSLKKSTFLKNWGDPKAIMIKNILYKNVKMYPHKV